MPSKVPFRPLVCHQGINSSRHRNSIRFGEWGVGGPDCKLHDSGAYCKPGIGREARAIRPDDGVPPAGVGLVIARRGTDLDWPAEGVRENSHRRGWRSMQGMWPRGGVIGACPPARLITALKRGRVLTGGGCGVSVTVSLGVHGRGGLWATNVTGGAGWTRARCSVDASAKSEACRMLQAAVYRCALPLKRWSVWQSNSEPTLCGGPRVAHGLLPGAGGASA